MDLGDFSWGHFLSEHNCQPWKTIPACYTTWQQLSSSVSLYCVVASMQLACHHRISLVWCRRHQHRVRIHQPRHRRCTSSISTVQHQLRRCASQRRAVTTTFLWWTSSVRTLLTFRTLSSSSRSSSVLLEFMRPGRVRQPRYQVRFARETYTGGVGSRG